MNSTFNVRGKDLKVIWKPYNPDDDNEDDIHTPQIIGIHTSQIIGILYYIKDINTKKNIDTIIDIVKSYIFEWNYNNLPDSPLGMYSWYAYCYQNKEYYWILKKIPKEIIISFELNEIIIFEYNKNKVAWVYFHDFYSDILIFADGNDKYKPVPLIMNTIQINELPWTPNNYYPVIEKKDTIPYWSLYLSNTNYIPELLFSIDNISLVWANVPTWFNYENKKYNQEMYPWAGYMLIHTSGDLKGKYFSESNKIKELEIKNPDSKKYKIIYILSQILAIWVYILEPI